MEKNENNEAVALERQKRMLSWMLSKDVPHLPTQEERAVYPQKTTDVFSKVFFWWLLPVMKTGYKRTLQPEDLYKLPEDITVNALAAIFFKHFDAGFSKSKAKHIALKCKKRGETPESTSVSEEADLEDYEIPTIVAIVALFKTFKSQYLLSCFFITLSSVANVVTPLLSKKLIQFVEDRSLGLETKVNKGIGYSVGAPLLILISGMLSTHFYYRAMMTGAEAKAVLTKAILKKSFVLSAESRNKYSTGKITSMMSTDLARIDLALGSLPSAFVFPVPFVIAIAILVVNIGVSAVVGIGVMFAFIVLIGLCMGFLFSLREKASVFTDSRVDYMKEILSNLKIIKFYAWEQPSLERIADIRKREMKLIYRMQIIRAVTMAVAISLTIISSMVAFLVLHRINSGDRTPANIFSSISLFNILTISLFMLPLSLSAGSDGLVGLGRVGRFLSASEVNLEAIKIQAEPAELSRMEEDKIAIELTEASFEWEVYELEDEEKEKDKEAKNKKSKDNNSKDRKSKDKRQNEKKSKDKTAKDEKSKVKTPDDENLVGKPSTDKETEEKEDEQDVLSRGKKSKDAETHQSEDDISKKEVLSDLVLENSPEVEFPGLQSINLSIKKGEFIVITGLIGSGKSSLLNALSGFMNRTQGTINVNGSLILSGIPWVQNATIQNNIVFGEVYDEERYKEVVYSCSLESDFDIFPAGDQTEVGERGITLSGGQKARVCLARAVYANKDIILLDDVLSAVDARVGKHIVDCCILGLLKDRTRVLATHQLSLIGAADRIIFVNGDGSITVGTFDELQNNNAAFVSLMKYNKNKEVTAADSNAKNDPETVREVTKLERESVSSENDSNDEERERKAYNNSNTDDGQLIQEEEKSVNRIKASVYFDYFTVGESKFGSLIFLPAFVICMAFATFCEIFTNTWLSFWTEYKFEGMTDGFYIGIYIMFSMATVMFYTIEFSLLVYITNTSSTRLNVLAADKALHTPMSFMDTTPMGRILNRFTKDTDALDNEVGDEMMFFVVVFSSVVGVIILCVVYLPWFAIAVPAIAYIFIAVADFYQASAREIKRLEAVQRSHVFNNFSEILNGMNTIKSYGEERRFMQKNDVYIDNMNEAYYLTIANQRWLSVHLDILATCFAFIISILCVCRVFKLSASSVGLLLANVYEVAGQMSQLIRTYTQMENAMNSVERVSEYAFKLPQEAPSLVTETTPEESWPSRGEISFENVSLAYRPGLPLVLKDISFSIKSSEKIGICGRTGAGKSSIMSALYRLSELQAGKVIIDDIDVSTLGLQSLRSKLSIIPQDPVLFKGTIRRNLDPFDERTDDELWDALRRTGLIESDRLETVKAQVKIAAEDDKAAETIHKFHLNQLVEDEGSNFSLGEKQLISFARALVRDSRILILDEATSSVDYETDSKIQATIVKEFGQCTILCIAHRLKTIVNYDRIIVLDKGEIEEFDTPINLFNKENSIFQQMCQKSGITAEDFKDSERF